MAKQNIERRIFAEVRAEEGEDAEPVLRGYAARFNSDSLDLGGFIEQIAPGTFADSLDSGEQIHAFWSHDPAMPLGSTRGGKLKLWEDEDGLAFELKGKRLTEPQLDAVRDGDMKMSFGFVTRKDAWDRTAKPPKRTLMDVELHEVSLVAMPAYPETSAALRSLEAAMATDTTALPVLGATDTTATGNTIESAPAFSFARAYEMQRGSEMEAGLPVVFGEDAED